MAVFCRPVLTAPAAIRGDGGVLADAWLPDQVRLGELEAHPGGGVIEAIVDAEFARRLVRRQRRRIMSYQTFLMTSDGVPRGSPGFGLREQRTVARLWITLRS
jgi:hypothetical protein